MGFQQLQDKYGCCADKFSCIYEEALMKSHIYYDDVWIETFGPQHDTASHVDLTHIEALRRAGPSLKQVITSVVLLLNCGQLD